VLLTIVHTCTFDALSGFPDAASIATLRARGVT
jgi:hypothetical protein